MAHKVAILDDYQHIALSSADWSSILPQVSIDVYDSTIQTSDEDALAKRLYPYEIICLMRERTKITKSLLDRLPNLKFISSTAVRNLAIDLEACKERGVVVSHTGVTGNATLEHMYVLLDLLLDEMLNLGLPWLHADGL
jgi:26S proteasome regulatory subunit N2